MLHNEVFISHVEEHFMNWDDDGEMVVQVLVGILQKPGGGDFREVISPDKWAFAKSLLNISLTERLA